MRIIICGGGGIKHDHIDNGDANDIVYDHDDHNDDNYKTAD